MKNRFLKTLFIFRRDLRLEDNTGLIFALKSSRAVIPAFIFTDEQIATNPYRSDHCLQFMIESLQDLEKQLHEKGGKLYFFQGAPEAIALQLISTLHIEALVVNRDYTPYSHKRDQLLEKACKAHNVSFFSFEDALLHPPEETLKKDERPYTLFTPYFRNASKQPVLPPSPNLDTNYFHQPIPFAKDRSILATLLPTKHTKNGLLGGRTETLKILQSLSSFQEYEHLRDFPEKNYSTHLSAHLKFTACSPREVYATLHKNVTPPLGLIRSLYWRDFFSMIAFYFPQVFNGAFHTKFNRIKWENHPKKFQKWCCGMTGFPIVDAGMRELNETGFMHNRARMITASFLIKDLHIDWRWGEKYFAQTLIDYDPSVNNGNWQWVAGTGADAQPYFRIFNPWRQQKKFDPECNYIKRWIPELRDMPHQMIHRWNDTEVHTLCPEYPPPMTDHDNASKQSICLYQSAAG